MVMGGTNKFRAFAVSNYTNVEDAVTGSSDLLIATVAMEYSPLPSGGPPITKFYVFNSNGVRVTSAALDGGGQKFVPGLCIVCHGGTNPTTHTNNYFGLENVHAHFLPFDLRSFDYSCDPEFSRSIQEPAFRSFNQKVLEIESSFVTNDPPYLRRAITNLIEGWYGGANLPRQTQYEFFVPSGWVNTNTNLSVTARSYLYLNVVALSCRSCHVARPDFPFALDFDEFADFESLKSIISPDVFGRDISSLASSPITANDNASIHMPQARRTFERFWNSVSPRPQAEILRDYLTGALTNYSTPPSIVTIAKAGTDLEISFTTSNNGSYRLEQADNLTAPSVWTSVADFSGTGGTNQVVLPIDPNQPHRFFHVHSLP